MIGSPDLQKQPKAEPLILPNPILHSDDQTYDRLSDGLEFSPNSTIGAIRPVKLHNLRVILFLVMGYFGSAYFAAAALAPDYAFEIGLVAVIVALAVYQFLIYRFGDQSNILFAMLLTLPFSLLILGMAWWLMRLLGFWKFN